MAEGNCPATVAISEAVRKQLGVHLFGQRVCVAKCDIGLVGRSFWGDPVEDPASLFALVLGPFTNWRAATNDSVLFLNFGRSYLRDDGSNVALQSSQWDQITVCLLTCQDPSSRITEESGDVQIDVSENRQPPPQ